MSDGTSLNVGAAGDTIFDEDVSADAVGGFSGKLAGFGIYVGTKGNLGTRVSELRPLPTNNAEAVSALRELLSEAQQLNDRLGDLGAVLSVHDDYIVVRDTVGIQFGIAGPRIISQAGVPTRTDLADGSLCMRSDPGTASTALYVCVDGAWTALT